MRTFKKSEDIKCATVGYGGAFSIGRQHLTEMARAGMTPTAVVDPDAARLAVAGEDFPGIETYASLTALLKHSDANLLAICTPHNTHARLALQALKAGRHVVCEKPFAIKTTECDAMIKAAKTRGLTLSTYHNRHWDGCILQAVKLIRQGVIGDVYRVEAHMGGYGAPGTSWRSSKSRSGGVLYDWGVHLLEYSLQLLEGEIAEVTGLAKRGVWAGKSAWKADTNEDEATAVVRMRSGAWLTLSMSRLDANPKRGMLEVTGTKGTYIMDHRQYETIVPKGKRTVRTTGQNVGSESWRFYQNIADHMVKGADLVITPEWARRPIHILDLADRSARTGRAMKATYR